MSKLPRFTRQISGLVIFIVALSFGLSPHVLSAQPPVDIRGEWAVTTTAAGTNYPQTLDITGEDFASGQISGTDTGSGGSAFAMTGAVSGNTITMLISDVNYRSNTTATISGISPSMSISGTFTDSHNTNGTFSAKLTIPANFGPSATTGPLATPITTANNQATAVASTGAAVGITAPTDPNPPGDNLPILPLGLAALLLLGLGGAAAAGLVPGVSGLGGSATTSGTGASETVADNTGQQIERMKVMQDTRPDFVPPQPASPAKFTPPDPLTSPGDQPPASGQQTERHKIMQDQQPSTMPNQQDSSSNKSAPATGPATRADPYIRAEAPPNPAATDAVASTGTSPLDGSPGA